MGVAVAMAIGIAACGDDADTATTGTKPPEATATTATAAAKNSVTITATDYAFATSGPVHPGMVDVVFDNQGGAYHMVEMAKLKDGVTKTQVDEAMSKGEDALMELLAGNPDEASVSGLPAIIAPGARAESVAEIADAGTYVMLCFVPGPDGAPHAAMGMVDTLEVTGDEAGSAPKTDGTITLTDTGIELPDAAKSGKGWFAVENTGTAPHTISFTTLPKGTTVDDEYQWVGEHFAQGQPLVGAPGDLVTGVNVVPPGETVYLHLDLSPGHYGFVSTEGEPPNDDFSHGLKGEFDVE
jgi:hypothetical protein